MTDISSQTLHIVAKELMATLNEARAALEAYAERSDQTAFLEKCADQLHLAHGVLRLVEVYGAALLAEEMEHVTRYIHVAGSDQKRQVEGLDALMRAMVQLPTYLERVLSGGRDLALVLLFAGAPSYPRGRCCFSISNPTSRPNRSPCKANRRFRSHNGGGGCALVFKSDCWDIFAANEPYRISKFWRR
jgi:hypothetical protein